MAGKIILGYKSEDPSKPNVTVHDADDGSVLASLNIGGTNNYVHRVAFDPTSDNKVIMVTDGSPFTSQGIIGWLSDDGATTVFGTTNSGVHPPGSIYMARGAHRRGDVGFIFADTAIMSTAKTPGGTYAMATNALNLTTQSTPLFGANGSRVKDMQVRSSTDIWCLANEYNGAVVANFGIFRTVVGAPDPVSGIIAGPDWTPIFTEANINADIGPGTWQAGEYPRRFALHPTQTKVFLLSTHRLYYFDGVSWSIAWDFRATLTSASYVFADNAIGHWLLPFDDLKVDWNTNYAFMSGGAGLYGWHSNTDGVPSCGFGTTPGTMEDHAHVALDGSLRVLLVQSRYNNDLGSGVPDLSPSPCSAGQPSNAGLWRSTSPTGSLMESGAFLGWTMFDADANSNNLPVAIDSIREPQVMGCTDPAACNYDAAANYESLNCRSAVTLTNCETADTLVTDTPEATFLAARTGGMIEMALQVSTSATVASLLVQVQGSVLFNWSGNLGTLVGTSSPVRWNEMMRQFMAAFNAAGLGWTAVVIPNSLTTLTGVDPSQIVVGLVSNTATPNGQAVNVTGFGVTATQGVNYTASVDNGRSAGTVKIAGVEGCWTVTGPGDCLAAVPVVVEAVYEDCFRCVPYLPPTVCRDCDSMATVGGTAIASSIDPARAACVVAGQVLNLNMLIGFPEPTQQNLVPVEVGTGCQPSCIVTYTFTGDQTLSFQPGSTFLFNPGSIPYTVATVSYDSGTNLTTVTTVENCQSNDPVESVDTNEGCDCTVVVNIYNVITEALLSTTTYNCVDGYVNQLQNWTIPAEGTYMVEIVADYCGNTRTCTYYLAACAEYVFRETACHAFDITIQRPRVAANPASITHTITIQDLADGTVLVDAVQVTEDQLPYAFTSPGDGVYKVTTTNSITTQTTVGYIFDLCDTRACRKTLIESLFCACDDPCATDPGCKESADRDDTRYALQRVMLMWSAVEAAVYTHRFCYLGIPTMSAQREAETLNIALLIAKLRDVVSSCGECTGTGTTTSTCSDCQ